MSGEKISDRNYLLKCYHRLYSHFGPQNWWPGESTFEIIVGAVLTQNTSWNNVEKCIQNLKEANLLSLPALLKARPETVKQKIKSCGYYNIKYERLINLLQFFNRNGSFKYFKNGEVSQLREELLSIKGIGKETADSILLYAFEREIFVVDAYTRRLFSRLRYPEFENIEYDEIREFFQNNLPGDVRLYNEYHALIVKQAKDICVKTPRCQSCVLRDICLSVL